MRKRVWITGAGGLIGHALVQTAHSHDFDPIPITRCVLDVTDASAVRATFRRDPPDAVIHCAALSKTPACQENPALARRINIESTQLIAELAEDIPLIFFSTDLVFDGKKGNYLESDPVNPLTVYSETKAVAERIVLRNPRHLVVRTSLNAGISPTRDRGFNEEIRRALESGRTLKLFADEFRCPIPAAITARGVLELLSKNQTGLFHLAGSERLSRWQIGQLLADRWGVLPGRIESSSLREHHGPARAPDTSLDCSKIASLLSFRLPKFSDWLESQPSPAI